MNHEHTLDFRLRTSIVVCLLALLAIPISSNLDAAPFQSSKKETPDPYFNKPLKPRPILRSQSGSDYPFMQPVDSNRNLPSSGSGQIIKSEVNMPNAGAGAIWKAPVTPVAGNRIATNFSNDFQKPSNIPTVAESTSHDAKSSWNNPITNSPTPNSIIREPKSSNPPDSNDFQPGATSIPKVRSPMEIGASQFDVKLPSTNSIESPNQFAARSTKDFQLPNSFGTTTPQSAETPPPAKAFSPSIKPNPRSAFTNTPAQQKMDSPRSISKPGLKTFEPGKVLALVGGKPIFVGDMLFEINQLIERFMPGAPSEIKELERQKMIPKILPKFVEAKLLFHGMLRQLPEGVDIDKVLEQAASEFDDKALNIMIENSGLKSASEFDAHLRAQGSSLRNLRHSWATDQLTKYFLSQKLSVDAEVTHQELLNMYRENRDSYAVKGKVRWEQIMIRFDQSESREDAKQKIAALGDQVVYGANLAAVAKKSSHGFMASSGGQHDWTSRGALVLKEVDKAIFEQPIGQLSDIIESPDGFHIVRVLERTDDHHTPFTEAQVEIKKQIIEKKRKAAYDEHLSNLKDQIPVEYFYDDPVGTESGL